MAFGRLKDRIPPALLRYLVVGGLGFIVDAGGLEALNRVLGMEVHLARICSMALAIACTYLLHRHFTFTDSRRPRRSSLQFVAFGAVQIAAAALNFGIFSIVLRFLPRPLPLLPAAVEPDAVNLFALGCGVATGLCANWLVLRLIVFPAVKDGEPDTAYQQPDNAVIARRRCTLGAVLLSALFTAAQIIPAISRQTDLLNFPALSGPLMPADPDIWIYLTQVRQWLADGLGFSSHALGGFYDHLVRNTNAPFNGIVIHWTRPMQLLLALFCLFTPNTLNLSLRVMMAANWLPAALCFTALSFLAGAAQRLFRHTAVLALTIFLMLINPEISKNFAAGNADHHGLLCMLWCGVLFLLLDGGFAAGGAFLTGVLLGIMTWIGIEGLLMAGFVFGLMGLESLLRPSKARLLAFATLGTALTVTVGIFVEMPPNQILSHPAYDTLSIVHVVLFWLTAGAAALLAVLFSPTAAGAQRLNLRGRFLAAGATGAGLLLGIFFLYPKFFKGVMVDADPFILSSNFPTIGEMKPLFEIPYGNILTELAAPVSAAILLFICLARRDMRFEKRRQLVILSLLLAGTLVCTVLANRWAYYLQPVAIAAIAGLLPGVAARVHGSSRLRWLRMVPRSWLCCLWFGLGYGVLCFLLPLHTTRISDSAYCTAQLRYVMETQQLQPLLGSKNLVLLVHESVAGDALFFTPYRTIAANLHREGPELHELRRIETAETEQQTEALLRERHTDALLYCPVRQEPTSFLRKITETGKYPAWLAPVEGLRFIDIPGARPVLLQVKK